MIRHAIKKTVLLGSALALAGAAWAGPSASHGSAGAGSSASNGSAVPAALTAGQQTRVESIIHDYLLAHPEVLVQSLQAYQEQQKAKQLQVSIDAVKQNAQALFSNPKVPSAGNPQGEVQLVEFYDFRCPHCKEASRTVGELVKKNPDLKVYYRDFPIFGGQSNQAAKASIAAFSLDPKKYVAFHDALMETKDPALSNDTIFKLAKQSGYDVVALKKAMKQSWVQDEINASYKVGGAIGVVATPMFAVGDLKTGKFQFVPGAYPEAVIQKALDEVKGS
jgi:protein-disulfide isomerase